MGSALFWDAVTSWTLPALIVAAGIFPPHVHPPLLAALALGALLLAVGLAGSGRLAAPGPAAAAPLLAAALIAALGAFLSLHPPRSARLLAAWVAGGVVFAGAFAAEGARARRATAALVLLGTLLGALGLYQSLWAFPAAAAGPPVAGDGEGPDREAVVEARIRSGRAVGTLGLPALLASILILGIPLAAGEAAASAGARRLAWASAAAVQSAALAATRSLGGAAALVLAAALGAAAWRDVRAAWRLALPAAALAAAVAAGAPRLLASGEGSAVQAISQRAGNWKAAASMIASHPLLGVGPDAYGVAYTRHRAAGSNEAQHAHAAYLELVADLGLPSAPLLLAALAGLGRAALLVSRRDADAGGAGPGAAARRRGRALAVACLAWVVQAAFDFTPHVAASFVPFLAAAGLLAREAASSGSSAGGRAPIRAAGAAARAAVVAAALIAAAPMVPDALARTRVEEAVEAARRSDFGAALGAARRACGFNPYDPEAHAVAAQAALESALRLQEGAPERQALLEEALAAAGRAVRLDPHAANRRAVLARARAATGEAAGAYAAMWAAARLNPFDAAYVQDRDLLREILEGRRPGETRALRPDGGGAGP
jgi:O-antigen ligase